MLRLNYKIGLIPMTIDKARELSRNQSQTAGGYAKNGARLILTEAQKEHVQEAVDQYIRELDLKKIFDFKPGTVFKGLTSG